MLDDLRMEVILGELQLTDYIQVKREGNFLLNGYCPIVYWYYNHPTMIKLENTDCDYTEEERAQKELFFQKYNEDIDLELMTVEDCINEMADMIDL